MPSEASKRWLAISQKFPIGPKRRSGLLRSTEPTEDVIPGQLRQAYWQDTSVVVVIDSIDDTNAQALVFPVTLEPGVENDAAVIIEGEASPLHGPITAWPDTMASVPFSALGARIAAVPKPLLRIIKETTSKKPVVEGFRQGYADPPLGSGAEIAIADLFDALDVLKTAPQLRPASGVTAITQLQIPLPAIMSASQVPQPRAVAIRMGKELLTFEDAQRLATTEGLPVSDVLGAIAPLPDDLRRELQEPRWRAHIRQRATDGDEEQARTRLGHEAYQLAARETGLGREYWRQCIETVLATGTR